MSEGNFLESLSLKERKVTVGRGGCWLKGEHFVSNTGNLSPNTNKKSPVKREKL